MKILVAEDEPILIRIIEMRLKKDGYEVLLAEDGQQALDRLEQGPPDLIITDIMMPYASGLEIIASVRARTWPKVPVIILSAMGQEDVVLEAFQLGADDYITKPFSPNELSVRVRRLLTR
ncbi:MAG TPA: response regulator transcription factor [Puia sp.]|jgi:DNA-binding response OmpR family regulator|nr:response regulator transcription factor [Puia sp.]